jgi:putative membrane protein
MSIWVDANGWPIPPLVLLGCLAVEILYFRRLRVLLAEEQRKAAQATNSPKLTGTEWSRWDSWRWRGVYFVSAIILALAGDSALVDLFSARLFWVHMVQHLVLLVIIAPLLVMAAPLRPLWLGLPGWVRWTIEGTAKLRVGRVVCRFGYWIGHGLRYPAVSCVLLIAGMWVWHWPALYDLALRNETIHDWCEHLTFLVVSVVFWTQVIPSPPLRPRVGYVGQLLYLGVAIFQNVVLAVLLAFAQVPLYAPYAHLAAVSGGFTALQDQQLGAGIMWTFGDVPFVIAIFILVQRWLASQSDGPGTADNARVPLKPHYNMQREVLVEVEGVNAFNSEPGERN